MGLHYLTLMGRNLENKEKLTPIRIVNAAGMNNMNNLYSANIFSDSAVISNIFNE